MLTSIRLYLIDAGMKQVWIVNHYAQEPSGPGGTRHHALARHLSAYGWQASIVAGSTELNTGRQRLFRGEPYRRETLEGVPFCWLRTADHASLSGRLIDMLGFAWRVVTSSCLRDLPSPDVVIGSSVHPFAAWAGLRLARRHRVPFIFEVRDLWPQTLVDLGVARESGLAVWALRKLERHLYQAAARIVVLMPRADEYICRLGIPREKLVWIPNGVELSGVAPAPKTPNEDGFTLMYFGAHGLANGLDNILTAMGRVRDKRPDLYVRLRLIGDGPQKAVLIGQAKRMGLDNVVFEPPVPKAAIPALAAEADAFVVNLVDSPIYRYGISLNKLFDYLAAGRPIVFAGAAVNDPVAEARAGLSVPPGDPEALAGAIVRLAALPEAERMEMGRNAYAYVQAHHDFRVLARRLADCLDAVVSERLVRDIR